MIENEFLIAFASQILGLKVATKSQAPLFTWSF